MASLDKVFSYVAKKFNIMELNSLQKDAINNFVHGSVDVFVNLPTGFGKSLIYQALPFVFDAMLDMPCQPGCPGHIVVVVSPLLNLIADQVRFLNSMGISAVSLSSVESEEERMQVERGEFSIVYGTPEAWLLNERWRSMLNSSTYLTKLCALAIDEAHVIKQWGTSANQGLAAFRECYSRLHELRTLAPKIKLIALTATATTSTRNTIFDLLNMKNPYIVFESPNKGNITYSVHYMPNDMDLEHYFGWLADELIANQELCDRTIIYCQTIKQCSILYATLKGLLRKSMSTGSDSKDVLIEMLHSCTPDSNKENILNSFTNEDGTIRVLIATISFGMGVDCKAVKRVIHFGPSKNIESYTQETGRAGRDGTQASALLLYNGILLSHVDPNIKLYIKSDQCRRKTLLDHFQASFNTPLPYHLCCDICAVKCECGLPECATRTAFPGEITKNKTSPALRSRKVSNQQKELVQNELNIYHKNLATKLMGTTPNNDIKILTDISFVIGFSDVQIHQVLYNLEHLFDVKDVCNLVEIWDISHAHKIIQIVSKVFQDVEFESSSEMVDDFEMDDIWFEDWDAIMEESVLINMAVDNLAVTGHSDSIDQNLSQIEDSIEHEEENDSDASFDTGAPDSIHTIMQELNLN